MKKKELGERNFGFDSLKSRQNHDMEEKGIVARDCLPLPVVEGPPPLAPSMEEAAEAGGGGAHCRYNPLPSLLQRQCHGRAAGYIGIVPIHDDLGVPPMGVGLV